MLKNLHHRDLTNQASFLDKYETQSKETFAKRRQKLLEICQKYNLTSSKLDDKYFEYIVCFQQFRVCIGLFQ